MQNRFRLVVAGLVLALATPFAGAWNGHGHMVVSKIIWDGLTPQQQQKCILVLSKLPIAEKTILKGMPKTLSGTERDEFMFLRAATYPDMIKSVGMVDPNDVHKPWHYIDYAYNLDGKQGPVPSTDWVPSDPVLKISDAVQALKWSESILTGPNHTPAEQAIALCWFLHLTGDLHQPLHAVTAYCNALPDTGDQGGNLVRVLTPSKSATNLHSLWDGLLGDNNKPSDASHDGAKLEIDPDLAKDKIPFPMDDLKYEDWAKESYDAAVKYAYLNGAVLPKGQQGEMIHDKSDPSGAVSLDDAYMTAAGKLAQQRAVAAGFRGAMKLRAMMK